MKILSNNFSRVTSALLLAAGLMFTGCKKEEAQLIPVDLSQEGTANCYIISSAGAYKFPATKGNSSKSVGTLATAEVLWETFGTRSLPKVGDLVKKVKVEDGYIVFQTPAGFKEGNALIAAKDEDGEILWSWHIWLTDQPEQQDYDNGAGTMMDRNLGATSTEQAECENLGLLYQWGRKDPFLNSKLVFGNSVVSSTLTWPDPIASESKTGTIEYATANPTTFIYYNYKNYDWYYTGDSTTDDTRWTESDEKKSVYDPCPAGWRVPDGDIWVKAAGTDSTLEDMFDGDNGGIDFTDTFSDDDIWYPAAGYLHAPGGILYDVGITGVYWTAASDGSKAVCMAFDTFDGADLAQTNIKATGQSIRCVKE